jgi:shikimate 5-dehydrogenase
MKSVPPALHPFLPANPLPIVLIGAGGIVRAAHLPAYQKSNFPVTGVYDLNLDRAKALAAEFGIPRVYATAFTTWTCCDLFWESLREYMQIRSADLQRDGLDRRLF